jgi:hypothetical protein
MIKHDPNRFLRAARVTKLCASRAVRVTFDDGSTELISRDYLVRTVERIGHPSAASFREHLIGSQP